MPSERNLLSDPKYDALADDVDAIADILRQRAIAARARTTEGLLDSLRHPAAYEDDAFGDLVIDVEHVDWFVSDPKGREMARAAEGELRKWLAGRDRGLAERALYVLVRLLGPEADVVAPALAEPGRIRSAALSALASFDELPPSLFPQLSAIAAAKGKRGSDALFEDAATLIAVLLRVRSDAVPGLVVRLLERDELRPAVLEALAKRDVQRLHAVPNEVRERFTRAIDIIEQSRTAGLPSRVELAVAASIVCLVDRDSSMASQALGVFDLLVVAKSHRGTSNEFRALADFLVRNVEGFDAQQIAKLASLMTAPIEQRFPAAAAAWVRLPLADAKESAKKFGIGPPELTHARWRAVAEAYRSARSPSEEVGALIPPPFRLPRPSS